MRIVGSDATVSVIEETSCRFDPSFRIESVSVIGRDTDSPPLDEEEDD